MKKFSLLLLVFLSTLTQAECLKKEEVPQKDVSSLEIGPHILTYSKDSCGIRGCEIMIYSKGILGCYENSLNARGHYVDGSLNRHSVVISFKGNKKTYKFDAAKAKFEN